MLHPLPSLSDTQNLAQKVADLVEQGDVLALRGGLGAGKTTFARALISELLGKETEVPSPTFTLVQTYAGPQFPIYHFDLYRLNAPDEVLELGWDDTEAGLALIEWPDKAGPYLPEWRLDLNFDLTGESRSVSLEPRGEIWQARLHGI